MRRLEEEAGIERSIAISTIIGKADTAASSSTIGPWISLGNASWKGCCVRRGWSSSNMKGARASSWASSILDPSLTISIEGLPIFHGGENSAGDHVPMSISNYGVIAERGWWVSRELEEGGKKQWKSRLFEDLGDINGRNNYLRWRRGRKILSDSKRKQWNNLIDNTIWTKREREKKRMSFRRWFLLFESDYNIGRKKEQMGLFGSSRNDGTNEHGDRIDFIM